MSSSKHQTIHISGLTCTSCEHLIESELKSSPGIESIKVDHRRGRAEISYDREDDLRTALTKINSLGHYFASLDKNNNNGANQKKNSLKDWLLSFFIVICLFLAYKIINNLGLLSFVNLKPASLSYGAAIMVGVVASLSTCLMVVGAVVLSFAAKYEAAGNWFSATFRPHLTFHLGRLMSFFMLGGLLGLLGGTLNLTSNFTGYFTLFIALILFFLGLNILGIAPSLSALGLRLPKRVYIFFNKLKSSSHPLAPFFLGALTFFLPCGFTQSMQLLALGSGSFMTGSLIMFFFALGTLPVLMGLGIATTRFKHLQLFTFKKVAGLIIIFFAFYSFSSGLALAGYNFSWPTLNSASQLSDNSPVVKSQDGFQIIKMTVDYRGFSPNVFNVQKNIPVRWLIDARELTGCNNEIIVPSLKINKKLSPGQNIIEFTPTAVGTLNFSCWMGMLRGKFIVSEGAGAVNLNNALSDDLAVNNQNNFPLNDKTAGCGCAGSF